MLDSQPEIIIENIKYFKIFTRISKWNSVAWNCAELREIAKRLEHIGRFLTLGYPCRTVSDTIGATKPKKFWESNDLYLNFYLCPTLDRVMVLVFSVLVPLDVNRPNLRLAGELEISFLNKQTYCQNQFLCVNTCKSVNLFFQHWLWKNKK